MSKQWSLERKELEKISRYFGKPCNEVKYEQLYQQLDDVCNIFSNKNSVKTLTRKIIEEVVNIIEHNKSWTTIRVRTNLNSTKTRFKAEMHYDGGEYYDPKENGIGNVIGSIEKFKSYERDVDISSQTKEITIKINIAP